LEIQNLSFDIKNRYASFLLAEEGGPAKRRPGEYPPPDIKKSPNLLQKHLH
jgi:hypothetical protein